LIYTPSPYIPEPPKFKYMPKSKEVSKSKEVDIINQKREKTDLIREKEGEEFKIGDSVRVLRKKKLLIIMVTLLILYTINFVKFKEMQNFVNVQKILIAL
jgi:hypothetical protein